MKKHFVDSKGDPFKLQSDDLPEWNYSRTSQPGSGMSVAANARYSKEDVEEIYKKKLKEENELFDHFITTGEVVDKVKK